MQKQTQPFPVPARQTLPKRAKSSQAQYRPNEPTPPLSPIAIRSSAHLSQRPSPFHLIFYKTKPPKTKNFLNSIVHNNLRFTKTVAPPPNSNRSTLHPHGKRMASVGFNSATCCPKPLLL